ncbi:MAG: undecaprenyl-diphosphatase [Candidatus Dojkabacteria bacterium]|nr:MAG: undecaprenyl-diphosphatase [Candidatus Dojkabacteria bacterium]
MFETIVLGLIQGLAEFLPISSSGHVLIVEYLLNIQNNKGFDAAIHLATCLAAIIYFNRDMIAIFKSFIHWGDKSLNTDKQLGLYVVAATIPAIILGFIAKTLNIDELFDSPVSIGLSSIFFATLLYFTYTHTQGHGKLNLFSSVLIGASQIIAAIFPGASRSGITITTALAFNIEREAAAKFVFLISIPVTALAALNELVLEKTVAINLQFLIAFITAFISGLFAIHFLLYFIKNRSLEWIIGYRILFGIFAIIISMI